MADPLTLTLLATQGAGVGLEVFGSLQARSAEKRARRKQRQQTFKAVEREQRDLARLRGSQRAGFGAAGITGAGTPAAVGAMTAMDSMLDQEAILAGVSIMSQASRDRSRAALIGAVGGGLIGLGELGLTFQRSRST